MVHNSHFTLVSKNYGPCALVLQTHFMRDKYRRDTLMEQNLNNQIIPSTNFFLECFLGSGA